MSTWNYTQQTEALLMKKTYGPHIDKQFNKDNVLFGRMKKRVDFEGEENQITIQFSIFNIILYFFIVFFNQWV